MPERIVLLSHPLGTATPTWRDNPPVAIAPYSRIVDGDVANQHVLTTLNHNGTHVDAPLHFAPGGRSLTDFSPEEWLFSAPRLIDVPRTDDELIDVPDLEPHAATIAEADLLLIRTGFERFRGDAARFGQRAPGFAAAAGPFLLGFGGLRAVGMDVPSATAPAHLDEGIAFHQAVLGTGQAEPRTLLLVEDVHLAALDVPAPAEVVVAPLLLDGLDGAPATILARVRA